ncbi:hypothetical protein PAXRUDRAFT_828758 [Paxillus rubicundulus Ve08.2h10]|uniref:GRIP domain-containing protein n=1 Tax=Paxillus rubicundulus Ve08.2h10 TaxID=930991 RepID=A0A0D0DVP9_9AGAM|nr:hypothetical protein PAXRUDRAFT_828758 [Paxillus rubicundulus Ve08.2h10]
MFSQFRQAVESFAQPLPRQSQDNGSFTDGDNTRSRSPDVNSPVRPSSPHSSVQLAENALVNLRKSLATQRSPSPALHSTGNPQPRSGSPGPSSLPKGNSDSGLRKTTLEERLRASFVVGDASGGTTPNPSTRASPTPPAPIAQHPLSPTSTPLPESPNIPTATIPSHPETPPAISVSSKYTDPLLVAEEPSAVPESPNLEAETPSTNSQDSASLDPVTDISQQEDANAEGDVMSSEVIPSSLPSGEIRQVMDEELQPKAQKEIDTPETERPSEENVPVSSEPPTQNRPSNVDVDVLQGRLKLVEQRFTDISTSFKRLQAERQAADSVIRELTPLEDTKDAAVLRDYLVNINMKVELSQDELQRLNGKLTRQEERFEELRDTHRLQMASQSDQIATLRQQLSEAEALISASQASASQIEEDSVKRISELQQLHAEVAKAKEAAKEEEEKRVKAISLLKTVRQKLVKAEKDRDDAMRELADMREKERQDMEKDRAERAKLQSEIDAANLEREKVVSGLRTRFDKDIAAAKDRAEKDIQAARKQLDAELGALKASHSADISSKKSHISTLENSVNNLSSENKTFFEQLQLRQAEFESSQCHAESLQAQNTELQFQLKELQEQNDLLHDELGDLQGERTVRPQAPGASPEEISQLVSSVEIKYEAKLLELRRTLATVEKERNETDANWSRKLMEKANEMDQLKHILQSSAQSRERNENAAGALKAEIERFKSEARFQQGRLSELQSQIDAMKDAESALHRRISDAAARAGDSDKQLEEYRVREAQLRTHNKTLRDELRKVQNSIAVLERQRNPGVGYWTSATESRTSISSVSDAPSLSRAASPGPSSSSPALAKGDEEINFEYLRNVILQFLEHKEMRPNLVRVLSIILRFTPQETRRLIAKV